MENWIVYQGTINLVPIETETPCDRIYLEKFAFSNAMAASVKLGALESNLDKIIDSIEFLSEDMKRGRPFATSRYVANTDNTDFAKPNHGMDPNTQLFENFQNTSNKLPKK